MIPSTLLGIGLVIGGMVPSYYVNIAVGDRTLARVVYLVFWFSGLSLMVLG